MINGQNMQNWDLGEPKVQQFLREAGIAVGGQLEMNKNQYMLAQEALQ